MTDEEPDKKPTTKPAAAKAAAPSEPPPATVRKVGDWHLVTYGTWQISIGPDGLIMLPRHLHPREHEDFAG